MKLRTYSNLILLTSLTLFTACSGKMAKPEATLTTLQIIGVDTKVTTRTDQRINTSYIQEENLPMARTYPIYEEYIEAVQPMERTYSNYVSNVYIQNNFTVKNQVEEDAKQLLGRKYVWGATGPSTYDCSGFTQKIYRDAGINIPRVSRDQARVGQYVSYNNLQRGDMVFFDTKKKRSGKVSHVGIYLGNGNFIHASSAAKKIVIYNFDEKTFYKKRFLWARRVIKDNHYMASL